jgi:hypothetical protein
MKGTIAGFINCSIPASLGGLDNTRIRGVTAYVDQPLG